MGWWGRACGCGTEDKKSGRWTSEKKGGGEQTKGRRRSEFESWMGRISPRPPQSDWGIVGRVGEGVNGPRIVVLQEVSCTAAHLDHCTPQRTAEDGWQGALPLVIRSCLNEDHKHSNPNGKHRNASLGRCRSRYLYLSRALSRACPALPTLSPDATVTGTN